jgi:hypothetical protein
MMRGRVHRGDVITTAADARIPDGMSTGIERR